jgi:hypothetical protein
MLLGLSGTKSIVDTDLMHPWALSWSSAKVWSQVHGSVMPTDNCYISLRESTLLEGPDGDFCLDLAVGIDSEEVGAELIDGVEH